MTVHTVTFECKVLNTLVTWKVSVTEDCKISVAWKAIFEKEKETKYPKEEHTHIDIVAEARKFVKFFFEGFVVKLTFCVNNSILWLMCECFYTCKLDTENVDWCNIR